MDSKFIKDRERTIYYISTFVEVFISVITFYVALYIRDHFFQKSFLYTREYQILILVLIFTWFFLLKSKNFEKFHRSKSYSAILIDYTKGIIWGTALLIGAIFIFKLETISRSFILLFAVLNLMVLYVYRMSFFILLKYYRSKGKNQRNILIIGDETSENIIESIIKNKDWGLKIVTIISNSISIVEKYSSFIPVIPENGNINKILELDIIDEVIYYKNAIDQKELNEIFYSCEEVGVVCNVYSGMWNISGRKYHISYFGENPYFTFMNKPSDYMALFAKDLIDYTMAFILTMIFLPLMTVVAAAIKLDTKGPVFFIQERVGLRGRKFPIYKFRTMVANAEKMKQQVAGFNEMDGPAFKIKKDPRITRVGAFLRKTGLDELPQLFNILKGEMSFIGPRPPLHEEVEKYERWQLRRLSMKPGISCIWQTMPNRNDIVFKYWMELDLKYIDSWSLKLDFILFIRTFKTVLLGSGR